MDRAVRELYWDDDTLVVEFVTGELYHFEGAYISDFNFVGEESEGLQVTRVQVTSENCSIKLEDL